MTAAPPIEVSFGSPKLQLLPSALKTAGPDKLWYIGKHHEITLLYNSADFYNEPRNLTHMQVIDNLLKVNNLHTFFLTGIFKIHKSLGGVEWNKHKQACYGRKKQS